ncbi:hypothetical protein [Rhizobium leguminosarum]
MRIEIDLETVRQIDAEAPDLFLAGWMIVPSNQSERRADAAFPLHVNVFYYVILVSMLVASLIENKRNSRMVRSSMVRVKASRAI